MTTKTISSTTDLVSSRTRKRRFWTIVLAILLGLTALFSFYILLAWPWMQTWGATEAEVKATLPGDDIVSGANLQSTKGITIQAPPEAVYPWLLQLGVDRGGMYSYDWLENLFGLNVHTTDQIDAAYQEVEIGDFWRFTPEDYVLNPGPGLYVQQLIENEAVLLCFGMEGMSEEPCIDSWQFVLVPQGEDSTRLLLRSNMAIQPELPIKLTYYFQFIMERKMLLTLRDRAEGLVMSDQPIENLLEEEIHDTSLPSVGLIAIWPANGESVDNQPVLQWQAIPGAEKYQVAVVDDDTSTLMEAYGRTTIEPVLAIDPALPPGNYTWTVRALDQSANVLAELNSTFFVKDSIEQMAPDQWEETGEQPTLQWEVYPGVETYQVLVIDDDTFPPVVVVDQETAETSFSIEEALEQGSYSWTVWAKDSNGQVIAELNSNFFVGSMSE